MKFGPTARTWLLMKRRDQDRRKATRPIVPYTARTVIAPGTARAYEINLANVGWMRDQLSPVV
jgi:hypothetical protein